MGHGLHIKSLFSIFLNSEKQRPVYSAVTEVSESSVEEKTFNEIFDTSITSGVYICLST